MEFKIQTLNKIAKCGLNLLDRDIYEVASDMNNPDAYLVRSQDMHSMNIPESVKAVARAGAGTNNIPIPELTEKGIVVFNTPGANANAVKELVILSLLSTVIVPFVIPPFLFLRCGDWHGKSFRIIGASGARKFAN